MFKYQKMIYKFQIKRALPLIFLILYFANPFGLYAQEFNCTVSVNARQISGSSYDYISELEDELEGYINENRWTDDRYEDFERIVCAIQIVITGVDRDYNFTAETVFSVRRPIYNTNQLSSNIVLSDNNWVFNYPRNKNLVKDELQFDDLTSFIDFYMNIILGYDYDSFSELGGSRYFNRAQNIFELARNTGTQGWGRSIGAQRNRYGLINDLSSSSYIDYRRAIYGYHRLGLDQFTLDPELAREEILQALELLRNSKRVTGNNYLFDLFFGTKYTEIVAVMQDADADKRREAYNLLRDADPANTSAYEELL